MVLRRVLVSGPITALAAASPQQKVTISGRRTSGPRGGRKEGPQGRKGVHEPLALREHGTIISPLKWRRRCVCRRLTLFVYISYMSLCPSLWLC